MTALKFPPFLQPGDRLSIVSPSGRLLEQSAFKEGVELWRAEGYELIFSDGWDARWGYLAGRDSVRHSALAKAWLDPDCKGILCSRGGYGAMRLLEDWDWQTTDVIPKWIIGFSDITALIWSLASVGIASLHGPVLTTLAKEPAWSRQRLFDFLAGRPLPPLEGTGWGHGQGKGTLLPGNLAVATHLLTTALQPNLDSVILAFEDVGEAPYRLDRLLTQWRLMGSFAKVKGIALGRFSYCDELGTADSFRVAEVLRDRLGDHEIPIVSDLPFGHDGVNVPLPTGMPVVLDGDRGQLSFGEPPNMENRVSEMG